MRFLIPILSVVWYLSNVTATLAITICPGSPAKETTTNFKRADWHNCIGDFEHTSFYINGKARTSRYVGPFKNGKLTGYGFYTFWNYSLNTGFTWEGDFKGDRNVKIHKNYPQLQLSQIPFSLETLASKNSMGGQQKQAPKTRKALLLEVEFYSLTKSNRFLVQTILKELGLYRNEIDGLFGSGTRKALEQFNEKYLVLSSLNERRNVKFLYAEILKRGTSTIPADNEPTKPKKKLEKANPTVTTTTPKVPQKDQLDLALSEFQISTYGSFIHSRLVPEALFFFDQIETADSFEFRKALRNHKIETIVLSSPGGSVFEGLQMAAIISDKELNTYVPRNGFSDDIGICASACSYMFFAGKSRQAHGLLGVHQVYTPDATEREAVGKTEKIAQFTVSEIIGFLNEFGTPPWVFEKMFQQSKMYYFDRQEMQSLERFIGDGTRTQDTDIERFIRNFKAKFE